MASLNKVMLIGHLGADPEFKNVNGQDVCKFRIATSEKFVKNGQTLEQREWHKISVWGKLASTAAKFLHKGSKVFVEGKIKTTKWEKDGVKHSAVEIVGFNIVFLDSKKTESSQNEQQDVPQSSYEPVMEFSDIPF